MWELFRNWNRIRKGKLGILANHTTELNLKISFKKMPAFWLKDAQKGVPFGFNKTKELVSLITWKLLLHTAKNHLKKIINIRIRTVIVCNEEVRTQKINFLANLNFLYCIHNTLPCGSEPRPGRIFEGKNRRAKISWHWPFNSLKLVTVHHLLHDCFAVFILFCPPEGFKSSSWLFFYFNATRSKIKWCLNYVKNHNDLVKINLLNI
jgi:hypothetical protein